MLGGGFARFDAHVDYFIGNNPIPVDTLDLNFFLQNPGVSPLPFNQILVDNGATPAIFGANTLTLSGFVRWQEDPMDLNVSPVPEPSTISLIALGSLAGLYGMARRSRKV